MTNSTCFNIVVCIKAEEEDEEEEDEEEDEEKELVDS